MPKKVNNKKSNKSKTKNSNSNKNIINIKIGGGKKGSSGKKPRQETPIIYNNVSQPTNRPQYLDTNTLSQQEQQYKVLSTVNKIKQDNEIKNLTKHMHTQTTEQQYPSTPQINSFSDQLPPYDNSFNSGVLPTEYFEFMSPNALSSLNQTKFSPEYSSIKRLDDYANKIDDSMDKIIKSESKKDKIMKDTQQYYRSIGISDDISKGLLKMNIFNTDKENNNPSSSSSSNFNNQYPENINLLSSTGNEPPTTTIHEFLEIKDPNLSTSENRYATLTSDDDNEKIVIPVDYEKQIINYDVLMEIAKNYDGKDPDKYLNGAYLNKVNMLKKSMDQKHVTKLKFTSLINFLNDVNTNNHIKTLKLFDEEQNNKLKKSKK
jgi:hypothetical protein